MSQVFWAQGSATLNCVPDLKADGDAVALPMHAAEADRLLTASAAGGEASPLRRSVAGSLVSLDTGTITCLDGLLRRVQEKLAFRGVRR